MAVWNGQHVHEGPPPVRRRPIHAPRVSIGFELGAPLPRSLRPALPELEAPLLELPLDALELMPLPPRSRVPHSVAFSAVVGLACGVGWAWAEQAMAGAVAWVPSVLVAAPF